MKILDSTTYIYNPSLKQILCQVTFKQGGAVHTLVVDQTLKIIQDVKRMDCEFVSFEDQFKFGAKIHTKAGILKSVRDHHIVSGFNKAKESMFILKRKSLRA